MGNQAEDEVVISGKGQEMVSGKRRTTWYRESREGLVSIRKSPAVWRRWIWSCRSNAASPGIALQELRRTPC